MQGRLAAWVFDNIPLPPRAAPWVFGLIIGRVPRKMCGYCKGGTDENVAHCPVCEGSGMEQN